MRWFAICALLSGCHLVFELAPELPRDPGRFRKQISARLPTSVPDFRLAISTAADPELIVNAQTDGRDIYFTTVAGDPVPHELVAYSAGSLEAWVRVDLPAELFMYYGGEPLDDDPETVWQGFHAVWHVDDVLIGRDSAGSFDLIDVSGPPAAVDGVVGRGAELEESNENIGDSMCAPGSFKLTALSSFSYSLWVKRGVQIGEFDMPFDAGGNSRVYGGFSIEIGLADWKAGIADEVDIGYSLVPIGGSNNEWQHLAVSLERGTPSMIRTYLDGISAQSVMTTEGDITTTEPICLGGRYKFTGQVDEARIHDGALGAEWYAAEFVTADPQYLDFGPQEDVAP